MRSCVEPASRFSEGKPRPLGASRNAMRLLWSSGTLVVGGVMLVGFEIEDYGV